MNLDAFEHTIDGTATATGGEGTVNVAIIGPTGQGFTIPVSRVNVRFENGTAAVTIVAVSDVDLTPVPADAPKTHMAHVPGRGPVDLGHNPGDVSEDEWDAAIEEELEDDASDEGDPFDLVTADDDEVSA